VTATGLPTCYRHPDRETGLSCSECGRPICTECMTPAAVGIRCPDHAGRNRVVKAPRIVARPAGEAVATRALIGINVLVYAITAAQGIYHLRVALLSLHRVITIPDPIELDNIAPRISLLSRRGVLPLRYRTSEPAVVYLRASGLGANSGRSALFRGRAGGVHFRHTRLDGAEVRITLVAVDRAGNTSGPLEAGSLRLPA